MLHNVLGKKFSFCGPIEIETYFNSTLPPTWRGNQIISGEKNYPLCINKCETITKQVLFQITNI